MAIEKVCENCSSEGLFVKESLVNCVCLYIYVKV